MAGELDLFAGSDAASASGDILAALYDADFAAELLQPMALGPLVPTRELRQIGGELSISAGTHSIYKPAGSYTAPTAPPTYKLYIAGVERNVNWSLGRQAMSISMGIGQWATCTFSVISTDGSYRPTQDQEIVVVDMVTGARVFGGIIDSPGEEGQDGTTIVWTEVQAVGYGSKLDRTVFARYYDLTFQWTPQLVVRDLFLTVPELLATGITVGQSTDGDQFTTEIILPWDTASANLRRLLEPSGLDFVVDEYAQLHIVSKTTGYGSAPFNITNTNGMIDSDSLKVRRLRGDYANRIVVIPDIREPGFWTDTCSGDQSVGLYNFFQSTYILNDKPIVQVNGVTKTVGEYWTNASLYDFTYVPGGNGVYSATSYGSGDEITISHPIPIQPAVIADDLAEQSSFGAVVAAIVQIRDVYDRARLVEIAEGLLDRRKVRPYAIEYRTQQQGVRTGQTQTVTTTRPQASGVTILIDQVSGSFVPTGSGGFFRWSVSGANNSVIGERSSVRTNQRIVDALKRPQDRNRQIFSWTIAGTVERLTNPGVLQLGDDSETLPHGALEVTRHGYIKEVRLRFETPPTTGSVQIKVFLNGTNIFAVGGYIEFLPVDAADTVTNYQFASRPLPVVPGDRLTAEVQADNATAKDGILEVEQQG